MAQFMFNLFAHSYSSHVGILNLLIYRTEKAVLTSHYATWKHHMDFVALMVNGVGMSSQLLINFQCQDLQMQKYSVQMYQLGRY